METLYDVKILSGGPQVVVVGSYELKFGADGIASKVPEGAIKLLSRSKHCEVMEHHSK